MFQRLQRGAGRVFDNPQLWLTIIVAVAIVGSFLYIADRFITIARDAQERLVNVRVGALQDGFAPLAAVYMDDQATLLRHMQDIAAQNPTIVEFQIATEESRDSWVSVLSLDPTQVGRTQVGQNFLFSLAKADPKHSFTIEEVSGSERYFRTARAIVNSSSSVIGIALTRQTLSEADRSIAASITSSSIVLVVFLILLLVLFFHHARIVDYTALYKRLKEIDTLKDDFIGMVSHELRTPLTVIRGYIAELKSDSSSLTKDEALRRIDRSAEGLNMLVADMLDVARIEQGRMPFHIQKIDPSATISEVCESLKPAAAAKGLVLTCAMESGITIEVDPDRLRQIATNLINNAIKYSDKGEIAVKGSKDSSFILRVSDTGIGMTAETQAKIFGKFERAGGDRVRREIGTGLGLWITKQLVEQMNGRITVESIWGVGSHFIVTFPLA